MPKDAHALTDDPKFTAPGTAGFGLLTLRGYDLGADSPARSSGREVRDSGGRDFWGIAVPSCGGVSRGAVQWASPVEKAYPTENKRQSALRRFVGR